MTKVFSGYVCMSCLCVYSWASIIVLHEGNTIIFLLLSRNIHTLSLSLSLSLSLCSHGLDLVWRGGSELCLQWMPLPESSASIHSLSLTLKAAIPARKRVCVNEETRKRESLDVAGLLLDSGTCDCWLFMVWWSDGVRCFCTVEVIEVRITFKCFSILGLWSHAMLSVSSESSH